MSRNENDPQRQRLGKLLVAAAKQRRGHNDFWDWPDKDVMEVHVASEALKNAGYKLTNLRSRGACDPPDCEGDVNGAWTGVEVTELVDQATLEHVKATGENYHFADWPLEKFVEHLRGQVARKDQPDKIKGGRYDKYILVMHTDELVLKNGLLHDYVQQFKLETALIDTVLILNSFDPQLGCCPVLAVQVDKRGR